MLTEFGKVFIFFLLGGVFVAGGLVTNYIIRPARATREKSMIYECGEDPEGPAHIKFNIRFYVLALVFLLFDLEFVLLFPWATVFRELGVVAFWMGTSFVIILLIGDAYVWKKGDLNWVLPKPIKPDLGLLLIHDAPRFRPSAPVKQTEPVHN